ncbi:MAG: hypothetical protein Q9169_001915 [Polycauliona sp. 2 TL-2023]
MPPRKKPKSDLKPTSLQTLRRSSRTHAPEASITSRPSKCNTSAFFSLPSEIRNMIYSYLVYSPGGLVWFEINRMHRCDMQYWLVNHQWYREVSALFYRLNTFNFCSGYVRSGDDPFGPQLDRIERCCLHLALTRESSNAFITWFVEEFAAAVAPAKNLKYLIVRMAEHQKDCIKPLELLSNVYFAQVQLGRIQPYWSAYSRKPGKGVFYSTGSEKSAYEQRLERILMSDGRPVEEVSPGELANTYSSAPPLSTGLIGGALLEAQRRGGWADDYHLFNFLGIKLKREMMDDLQYTTG